MNIETPAPSSRTLRPRARQHLPDHGPGDAGPVARHPVRILAVRLAGDQSVHGDPEHRPGRRGRVSVGRRQTDSTLSDGRLRGPDRLAAGHDPAALGPVVDRRGRRTDRDRHRQTGVRRYRPESVQSRHGRARRAADLLSAGDDPLRQPGTLVRGREPGLADRAGNHLRRTGEPMPSPAPPCWVMCAPNLRRATSCRTSCPVSTRRRPTPWARSPGSWAKARRC